jgi:TPR repeat protein
MRHTSLSVMTLAAVLCAGPVQAQRGGERTHPIELAGGTDIIRILPPEARPTPPPVLDPKPEPPRPEVRPETRIDPPAPRPDPPTPPEKRVEKPLEQGRFVTAQVRRGITQTDQSRPWIGINADGLDRPLAISLGLKDPAGVLVLEAFAGSSAAQAGIKAGDVIVSFNGSPVADTGDFRRRLLGISPGNEAPIEVWRYFADGTDFVSSLRSLAEQGNASIMHRLGLMYARGSGVPRDEAEAARWYRQAANAGNASAMTELALMLFEGRGVERNTTEGLNLLKNAADTGNLPALFQYGQVLQAGKYATRDLAGAAQMFQRASDGGYSPAMVSLAIMHANGTGMPRNYQAAARLYEKALAQNNSAAMVNLGILYQYGNGVEKNETRAYELYKRATDLNHPTGMHNLAVLLDKGQGTARNSEQAAELVMRALKMRYDFSYKQMTTNGNSYTREFRIAMQRRLQEAGVYSGPLDGNFGQTTQTAITTYYNAKS